MCEYERIWARMWAIIAGLATIVLVVSIISCQIVTVEQYRNGYCDEQKQGSTETYRVKCK